MCVLNTCNRDFPGGLVVKNLPCIAGYAGSIRDLGTKVSHDAMKIPHVETKAHRSQINK